MRDWTVCPRCGQALREAGTGRELHVVCDGCGFFRYDNPLPTTIGVVVEAGRYLLLRRADEPHRGAWDSVGGFVSAGESAEECLVREGREEIGCELVDLEPLGSFPSVYGDTGLRTLGIAFRCGLPEGAEITLSSENTEYAWFAAGDLPPVAFGDVAAALNAATAGAGRRASAAGGTTG